MTGTPAIVRQPVTRPTPALASQRAFFGVAALLFAASAALTTCWSASMSSMAGMRMPGGWTMSMAWMRMPGETWLSSAASFVAMWAAMMVAMMLPSLLPTLRRYHRFLAESRGVRPATFTGLLGAGYFSVWTVLGIAIYPMGAALAALEMRQPMLARAVPAGASIVVLLAGVLQFTKWKARHLACCRDESSYDAPITHPNVRTAWREGISLGVHCVNRCASLTAILLALGVMDPRAMVAVTAAITLERFAPSGERASQTIGAVAIGTGIALLARAAGLA